MRRRLKRIENSKNRAERIAVIDKIKKLIDKHELVSANDLINSLIEENSEDDEALVLSAKVAYNFGAYKEAVEQANRAITVNNMNDDAYALLGKYYYNIFEYEKARQYYLKANRINDKNAEVAIGMTNVCLSLHHDEEALLFGESAVFLAPDNVYAHIVYADILRQGRRFEEAEEHYRTAVRINAKCSSAYLGLGIILYTTGRYEEAVEVYRHIPEKDVDSRIKWNSSLAYLATGRWQIGYRNYISGFETRTRSPDRLSSIRKPMWNGEDLSDKVIMIWREQGVGDELLFASFYNEIIKKAKKVIIECECRLVSVFKQTFPLAEVREQTASLDNVNVDGHVIYKETICDYDCHIPAMQIPQFLYNHPKDIPIADKTFLKIRNEINDKWKKRVSTLPGLKVGIIWRSGNIDRTRLREYLQVQDLSNTFGIKDVTFVNLMYAKCEEEKQYIKDNYGITLTEWDDLNLKDDFEDVMALTANLDLVVGAGTATTNISGLMMTPTVIFAPSYTWTTYGTKKSNIMPSVKYIVKGSASNSELDVRIASIIENFKTTRKIQS